MGPVLGPILGVLRCLLGGMDTYITSTSYAAPFRSLTAEWNQLCRSRRAADVVAQWRAAEPALSELARLGDLLQCRETDSESANELLGALLRVGDELACRAFVQAMLPAMVTLSRYGMAKRFVGPGRTWRDPRELSSELLSRTWIWVDRFRGDPPAWPAASLKCHLLHVIQSGAKRDDRDEVRLTPFCGTAHDRRGTEGVERAGIEGAAHMVCEAVEAGLLPLGYAQLLFSVRIRRDPYSVISERTGRSVDALKQQTRRAERSLARAVAA